MRRALVVGWLLAVALTFAVGAGKAQAAEPLPEETAVVAVDAPSSPAAAAEAVPSSGEEVEVSSAPWWMALVEGAALSIFALASSLFFGYVGKKVHDNEVYKAALRALEVGVNQEWVEVVRDLKEKASDGDGLTAREKEDARDSAIARAKKVATAPVKKLLEAMGKAVLESLVSKIVRKRKAGTV